MNQDIYSFNNKIYSNNNNLLIEIINDLKEVINNIKDNSIIKRIGDIIIKMNFIIKIIISAINFKNNYGERSIFDRENYK